MHFSFSEEDIKKHRLVKSVRLVLCCSADIICSVVLRVCVKDSSVMKSLGLCLLRNYNSQRA